MLKVMLKAVLAVLAIGIGAGLILWVVYNEVVERQPEYQRPPLFGLFGIAPVMIAVGIHWGRQALEGLGALGGGRHGQVTRSRSERWKEDSSS